MTVALSTAAAASAAGFCSSGANVWVNLTCITLSGCKVANKKRRSCCWGGNLKSLLHAANKNMSNM
jgi:hypothetical protein